MRTAREEHCPHPLACALVSDGFLLFTLLLSITFAGWELPTYFTSLSICKVAKDQRSHWVNLCTPQLPGQPVPRQRNPSYYQQILLTTSFPLIPSFDAREKRPAPSTHTACTCTCCITSLSMVLHDLPWQLCSSLHPPSSPCFSSSLHPPSVFCFLSCCLPG